MSKPEWNPLSLFLCPIALAVSILLYLVPADAFSPVPEPVTQVIRTTLLLAGLFLFLERVLRVRIYSKIFIGLVLGVTAGVLLGNPLGEIQPIGTAFIRLIRMIIIPLVFASLLVGTAGMNPRKMGRIGFKTLSYYLVYTAFAIFVGLILANVFQPGSGIPEEVKSQLLQNYGSEKAHISGLAEQANPIETLLNIIPTNIFEGLSQGALLQIIFFAIFSGVALTLIQKEKAETVIRFFDAVNDTMIAIVQIAIKIAPYGVFALIAAVVGNFGSDILLTLLQYTLVTIGGMILLNFTYPFVVRLFAGMAPMTFIKGIRSPQLIAFSTSSSSATLPVTIKVCEERLGVAPEIASFVLPLGATVNMNGTALYHGVSAVFIAQVFGIPLGWGDQLMIVLTATLAAIGAAGAPMAGILMLVIVLEQVGIPTEGIALIFGVERILDMFRTAVNITGDASAAVIIAASEGELGEPDV